MRIVILKFLPLVFLCCMISDMAFSQEKYFVVDSISASVKANSIEELHKSLTKDLSTDEEKIRSFYFWIAHNINYDVAEWTSPTSNFEKQTPVNVLKNKKAVCHGYSELFKSLCDLSGLKCFLVSGYTKKDGVFVNEGHTWNVVLLNGNWRQIDATWGAGGLDEQRKYVREFDNKYFMPDPKEFLKDHYPFDPAWQLVSSPVTLNNYRRRDWSYLENSKSTAYNFNDTIHVWMQNDSVSMQLLAANRMIRMNPDDLQSKKELSYALLDFAKAESLKGNLILEELYPEAKNKQTTANRKNIPANEFNAQLDAAYRHFSTADSVLRKIEVYSQSDRANVESNRKMLKHNMNVIDSERQ